MVRFEIRNSGVKFPDFKKVPGRQYGASSFENDVQAQHANCDSPGLQASLHLMLGVA